MRESAVTIHNSNETVTPYQTIDAIKKAGFKNVFVEWYNKDWECSQEEQIRYAREQGLNIIFAHLGYQHINSIWAEGELGDSQVERYINDLDICKRNNINLVIMHLTSKYEAPDFGEIGLNRLRKIALHAKKLGIKIAFENTKIKGYLDYVITNIQEDNVGICLDTGHLHCHFNDDLNFDLFKDKIFAVHMHDNDGSEDQHLIPFDGTIDWNWMIDRLDYCNYTGPVTMEVCYYGQYLDINIEDYYYKAYQIGEALSFMFEGDGNE